MKFAEAQVCLGYNPKTDSWGQVGINRNVVYNGGNCPTGYAYVGVNNPTGPSSLQGKYIAVLGDCCRVPEDALTNVHAYLTEECPKDYIATGTSSAVNISYEDYQKRTIQDGYREWMTTEQSMRCTKINTDRYQLGKPTPGYIWGWGKSFRSKNMKQTTRSSIPAALRYGIGRYKKSIWQSDGCVGYPWGSLLFKKTSKYCEDFSFRQLQYKGVGNDPKKGTPVEIFSNCKGVDDPLSPSAKCVK